MLASQSWARALLEGVVIVGSILLAFGVQAWWDARQEAELVDRGLRAILEELSVVRRQVVEDIPYSQSAFDNAERLLASLDSVADGAALTVPDTVLAALFWDYVLDAPTSMVGSFTSSGRLDALRSIELQRALLEWLSLIEDQRDDQTRTSQFGVVELRPFLRSHFEVRNAQRVELAEHDPSGSTRLQSTQELRNLVEWQRRWLWRLKGQDVALRLHGEKLDSLVRLELVF